VNVRDRILSISISATLVTLMVPLHAGALSPGVINGTDSGDLSNSVAYIEIFDSSCSAAVLAPTILVTAAHCVAESDDLPAASSSSIRVFAPGSDISNSEPTAAKVKRIIYDAKRYAANKEGWDVAFLVLDQPIGITPISRLATQEEASAITANKADLTFVGYGQVNPAGTSLPQDNSPRPLTSKARTYYWSYDLGAGAIDVAINGVSGPCYGDSGGPWMYQSGDELLLVGVESLGQGRPCDKTWDESFEEVPVISGVKGLVNQAYAAAGIAQPAVPTTCIKIQGEKQYCAQGRAWIYYHCWSGARATLQKLAASGWADVVTRKAPKGYGCKGKFPYGLTFAAFSDSAELERYRLVVPKQSGVSRITYEPFVVTRK